MPLTIAAALQLALTLGPPAEALVAELWAMLHGGARGTDQTPPQVEAAILETQAKVAQLEKDAGQAGNS